MDSGLLEVDGMISGPIFTCLQCSLVVIGILMVVVGVISNKVNHKEEKMSAKWVITAFLCCATGMLLLWFW